MLRGWIKSLFNTLSVHRKPDAASESSPQIAKRRVVCFFEHVVLRDCALKNHPVFLQWLLTPNDSDLLVQLLDSAVSITKSETTVSDAAIGAEYIALYQAVFVLHFEISSKQLYVITLPPPLLPLEAYAAVVVHERGEYRIPAIPSESTHYFVLERMKGFDQALLAEWMVAGRPRLFNMRSVPVAPQETAELIYDTLAKEFPESTKPRNGERARFCPPKTPEKLRIPRPSLEALVFPSLNKLLEHLDQLHTRQLWRYAYRGQIRRSSHRVVADASLECLVPSDFRDIAGHVQSTQEVTAMRKAGRDKRDAFTDFVFGRARAGDAHLRWIKDLLDKDEEELKKLFDIPDASDSEREASQSSAQSGGTAISNDESKLMIDGETAYKLMIDILVKQVQNGGNLGKWLYRASYSLAQHYLLPTSLLDLTFNPRIAAWFATNSWDPAREAPSEGEGVIYRVDLVALRQIFDAISPEHRQQAISMGKFPPPDMFAVSISNIPESVARRPSQQQGLSVYGFDRLDVLKALFAMGIVKPFLFAHSAPYSDDHVNRDLIQPSDDPFLETVRLFESTYVAPPPRPAPAL